MNALVLDGHLKSSLTAVRVLGKKGVSVHVGAERGSAMALHSRFATATFTYTSPKDNQQTFIDEVRAHAAAVHANTGDRLVVYCFSDATHLSLARVYDELRDVLLFPLPETEVLEIAFDKGKTHALADTNGVPTIATYDTEASKTIQFPAVVKPVHSVAWKDGKGFAGTASFVFSREELLEIVKEIKTETKETPLVQTFIKGDEYGVELLCNRGEVLQQFAHKRVRSLSPRGGAAVVKETAPSTPEVRMMVGYAKNLMKALSWTGPAMVEFKINNEDGSVRLMEINGRFWGSLPLAEKAGVDFVYGYYQLACGDVVKNPSDFSPRHVRTYHFLGDVKWLLSVLFSKDPLRNSLYPSRMRALWDFGTEIFKGTSDVYAFSDPLPSVYEVIDILKK